VRVGIEHTGREVPCVARRAGIARRVTGGAREVMGIRERGGGEGNGPLTGGPWRHMGWVWLAVVGR
jgi:hypothetical protein